MATIPILKADGAKAGDLDLADEVFGVEINPVCVTQAVHNYLANQRQGTHATKTRGKVSGGGKKPWKQKGTGRARQGSIRAPQWRGGAIIFGPQPRDYSYKLNRKVRQAAIRMALSDMAQEGRIIAVESYGLKDPKTARMAEVLEKVGVTGPALILTDATDSNLVLSARNLPYVSCIHPESPNIYELLTHDFLVGSPAQIKRLEEVFG